MDILFQSKNIKDTNNNWCVYSHFDKNGIVEPYVLDALKKIKVSGFKIVLVSTSPSIDYASIRKLKRLATVIAIRENIGYDFGSYKLGIQYLFANDIKPKQLLISNDSVFGPISDLKAVINKSKRFDVFGMTDSIDYAYHLQSYFIIYNQKVLKSKQFMEFWQSVKLVDSNTPNFKHLIIQNYEVGGTQFFIKNGFSVGAEFGITKIIKNQLSQFLSQIESAKNISDFKVERFIIGHNPTHNYWEALVHMGFPYIKRELLTTNPTNTSLENWVEVIKDKKTYNVKLIIDALINHFHNKDFIYTTQPSSTIVNQLKKDGIAKLTANPQFNKWKKLYSLPESKKFIFDSDYYLSVNLDVKAAIEKGDKINAIHHFLQHGCTENRPFKLVPLVNNIG